MRCRICSVEKLRKEFPSQTLSPDCNHPPLYCLRCAVKGAKDEKACPYEDCGEDVDDNRVEDCEQILRFLFPKIESTLPDISELEKSGEQVFIATLDGERTPVPYSPTLSIVQLKEQVQAKMQVDINKQKLVYQDADLEVYCEDGELKLLSDYAVPKGSTIHLMVLLYAIPDYMDNVIFDLSWGYPSSGRDFLDATCFSYSNSTHRGTVNYDNKVWPSTATSIEHSGDGMDDTNARGYHTIAVSLKKVPDYVTHLLFALSVWSNPSIALFRSPILRFYDAANKGKDLCNTSLSDASDSEAVVMCFVARKKSKKGWEIFESGQLSSGNSMNYDPLHETVKGIIAGRFPAKPNKGKVTRAPAAPISAPPSGASSGPRDVQIVFCFDTTGSMYDCLAQVKMKVQEIITRLLRDMPNIKISVFAHGDHDCPDPYVTTYLDFSNNVYTLCNFVERVEGTGGGGAECYEFALYEIRTKLSWKTGSNKSVVMIGDAYPHELGDPVNIPNVDWRNEAKRLFKDQGVRIYSVQCKSFMTNSTSNFFWQELSKLGHGKHLQLTNFTVIVDLLLAICYREGAPSLLRKFQQEVRDRGAMGETMSSIFQ